jgi:hypothetical protein
MPGPKQPPEYFEARRALNQHLHRHHEGAAGSGMLGERFELHDELHILAKRLGRELSHSHSEYPEGETDLAAALRLLKEGEDGEADATAHS